MKLFYICSMFVGLLITTSCTVKHKSDIVVLKGQWINEIDGKGMIDPQTSGLTFWRNKLLSLSDGSADTSQKNQLHVIDPLKGIVAKKSFAMTMSERVKASCFASYIADKPDLEALAVDPNNDNVFIVVTEDATRSESLSATCQKRYAGSGSTDFPTVLMRLELVDDSMLLITHVRPIQYNEDYHIGNFPNDGIEGLTFGLNNTLYLALERDQQGKARVFSVEINASFWQSEEFTQVKDTHVVLPTFDSLHHPINAITYVPKNNHKGYLIAAARNDNQLWLIDLENTVPTKVIPLAFLAPTHAKNLECEQWERIGNTSIEGAVYQNNQLWLVNDPWKKHYLDNIQCETNRKNYEQFVPLLFSLPVKSHWFK